MSTIINKPEIRKDYFLNKYVIIAPNRSKRPIDIKEKIITKRVAGCPFCKENISEENIIDRIISKKSEVLSIKNLFPALSLDNNKALGTQEVIIENQNHKKEMADFTINELLAILEMYAKRTLSLSTNKKINYILCFKNQGSKAGASIIHSHSQIFASEMLPPSAEEELLKTNDYISKNFSCPYCDIVKKESKSKRKIWSDKHILAFAPYASEFHYEAWIFTKNHIDNISNASNNELVSIAKALKLILVKLKKLDLSFNLFMNQVVKNENQHFYIKIQPRDSVWAGVELGSGLIINSIPPEQAADYFRK